MDRLIALDTCTNPKLERLRLEYEWEQFISGNTTNPAIRPLIYDSWKRCLEQNINPFQRKTSISLGKEQIEEFLSTDPLYHVLRPLLLNVKDISINSGHLLTFCNSSGDIVYLDGDLPLMLKAEDMNFVPGSSWAEHRAGTNAIGTALVTGSPIQVFAGEHFCQEVQKWTGSAAPIRDPATQNILGVIDLTGLWRANHPYSLSVVMSTAQTVEKHLYNQLKQERFRLLEYYSEIISSGTKSPLVVLDRGCKVIKASSILYEQSWIDSNHFLVGAPSIAFPLTSKMHWEAEHRKGIWRFELTPYIYGGNPIGAIVQVTPPILTASNHLFYPTKYLLPDHINEMPNSSSVVNGSNTATAPMDKKQPAFIESEEFYKSLFEHNPYAILCFDLEGNLLRANPATEKILGYTVEELQSITVRSLVLPKYEEKRAQCFENVIKGKPQEYEIAIRHKNGHIIDIRIKSFPMFAANEMVGIYAIVKDITKDKKIEEDLKSTKEQLELLTKNTADSIVVIDLQFNIVKVNEGFEKMFGWTEQEVVGGELPIIPDSLLDEFADMRREILNSRHVTSYETIRQHKNGSLINVNVFVSPLSDAKGNVVAFVAVLRDITERRRMEEALTESEKQLRTLINALPDFVCFKDGEGRWIEANEFGLRIFQLEDVPYQGKTNTELAHVNTFYCDALIKCQETDKKTWESGAKTRSEQVIPQVNSESKVFDFSELLAT